MGLGTIAGNLIAGTLSDRLASKDPARRLWVAGIGSILSIFVSVPFLLSSNSLVAMVSYGGFVVLQVIYVAPLIATIQLVVAPNIRGLAAAVMTFCQTLIGLGIGPFLVGALSDLFVPSQAEDALRWAMLLVSSGLFVGGIVCLFAIRPIRQGHPLAAEQ